MMVCMPVWVTSVLVSVGVSVATVLVVGLTVGPRLAARGKRIQAAHDSRDRFGQSVLDLLVLCGNRERVTILAEVTDPLRSRLQGERASWVGACASSRAARARPCWVYPRGPVASLGAASAAGLAGWSQLGRPFDGRPVRRTGGA